MAKSEIEALAGFVTSDHTGGIVAGKGDRLEVDIQTAQRLIKAKLAKKYRPPKKEKKQEA
jgi:hypothetical protein